MREVDWLDLQREIHECAVKHGFWPLGQNIPEKLCLIHSEVSEALEDYRNDNRRLSCNGNGKPEGFPVELADIVIRVLDLAENCGIDLLTNIRLKHAYNKTRPYRHGNKKA